MTSMELPKCLHKYFDNEKYRDDFFDGLIRFTDIKTYQNIDDQGRKDPDEGTGATGKYKTDLQTVTIDRGTGEILNNKPIPGDICISGESLNKLFICSLSDGNVNLEAASKRFGKYGIKITNIQSFLDLLNRNCKFDWLVGKIVLEKVNYNRGEYLPINKNATLPYVYLTAQKKSDYSRDFEWRFVLVGDAIKNIRREPVVINIGSLKNMASKINL